MKKSHEDSSDSSAWHYTLEEYNCLSDEQEEAVLEEFGDYLDATAPPDVMDLDARDALYADLLQTFHEHFQDKR